MKIQVPRSISFVNVGHFTPSPKRVGRRRWNACIEYGFLSAGQGRKYSKPFEKLAIGDIIAAFITDEGYVGVGKVLNTAVPINNFLYNGKTLRGLPYINERLFDNSENENSEYVIRVDWLKTVDIKNAFWKKNYGLFANQLTRCSLENQPTTIKFLEECFHVEFI